MKYPLKTGHSAPKRTTLRLGESFFPFCRAAEKSVRSTESARRSSEGSCGASGWGGNEAEFTQRSRGWVLASIRFFLSSIRMVLADVREILWDVMLALSFVSAGLC